jgi:hypothetical protein
LIEELDFCRADRFEVGSLFTELSRRFDGSMDGVVWNRFQFEDSFREWSFREFAQRRF